jgi:hypothetical protein
MKIVNEKRPTTVPSDDNDDDDDDSDDDDDDADDNNNVCYVRKHVERCCIIGALF